MKKRFVLLYSKAKTSALNLFELSLLSNLRLGRKVLFSPLISIAAGLFMLVLAACGADDSGRDIQAWDTPDLAVFEKMASAGELRLTALYYEKETQFYDLLAETKRLFEKEYRGWKVIIEPEGKLAFSTVTEGDIVYKYSIPDGEAAARFYNDLPGRLGEGDGTDVIFMEGADRDRLMREGLLEDLLPLMAADGEALYRTLLPRVLQAMERQEALYIMPSAFSVNGLIMYAGDDDELPPARELPQPFYWDTVPDFFQTELEWLERDCLFAATAEAFTIQLMEEYYSYVYDAETGKYRFGDEVFKEILLTVKLFYERGLLLDTDVETSYGNPSGMLMNYKLPNEVFEDYQSFKTQGADSRYYPLPALRGARGMACATAGEFAISANASNKAAAWAFIKILLSEELQSVTAVKYGQQIAADMSKQAVNWILGYGTNYNLPEWELNQFNNARRDYFSAIDRLRKTEVTHENTMDIILKHALRFYKGEGVLEDVIRQLRREADSQ
jgi:ABC-type glycerol-3-phosphate transport system substrate-binding protein